jgi:hypothetical protein
MARAGGILTFLMIGTVVLGMLLSLLGREAPALAVVSALLFLVAFVLWFVVMIALKVNFTQNGYPHGGVVIWFIILLVIAMIVVGVVAGVVAGGQIPRTGNPDPQAIARALGPWGAALGVLVLVMQFCFLVLGVRLNDYGNVGGGVWKGAGIVLIIGSCLGLLTTLLYIAAVLTQVWVLAIVGGVLGLVGMLLWAVVWLLIGIGFMGDANRLAAARR